MYSIDEEKVQDYAKQINGYNITNIYTGPSTPITPGTGDDKDISLWIWVMALSFIGFVISTIVNAKCNRYVAKHARKR